MDIVLDKFLNFIEIRTKITSIFVFSMAIGYLLYQEQRIDWKLTIIFFASMILFDFTTTAINNYIDSKSNQQELQFHRKTALVIIYLLFGLSAGLGLYLAYLTDAVILLVGGICFLCGVFYTYGPIPISRQPLGEIISGMFYGLCIPFILLYINMPVGTFLTLDLSVQTISVTLQVKPILSLVLFAMIPFCTTANIMLANNICDLEKDIKVKRHTLPYYIGRKRALFLFQSLYYLTYVAMIGMVIVKMIPFISLFALLTVYFVQKNIDIFFKEQIKTHTFIISIKNYVIIMGSTTVFLFMGTLMKRLS